MNFSLLHQLLLKLNITVDPEAFLTIFTLTAARLGAALPFIPFLGGQSVPETYESASR